MSGGKTKVLIVDDSAVIRAILTHTLQQGGDIEVVGVAHDGAEAVRATGELRPDIVVLDIEMPVMDGLTALPLILNQKPGTLVLICSTLSERGAEVSMRALALGATECILKPGGGSITTAQDFQQNLLRVVRALAPGGSSVAAPILKPASGPRLSPRILAIGSSTGGPKALEEVLKGLKNLPVPILVTQHMPKSFTTLLANNLRQSCGIPCFEGSDGLVLKPGGVYIAPGGMHMSLRAMGAETAIQLDDGPPENYCKPSVNPMLRALPRIYGGRVQVAILTGMGADGLEGCRDIIEQGGQVIAQDEATSVVWGMPGAVAAAGLCSAILPLPQIAPWLRQSITGQKEGVA